MSASGKIWACGANITNKMEICRGTGTIVRPSGRGPGHSHLASPTVTMQSGYPYELPSSPKNAPKSYDGGGSSNNTPTKSAVVSPRAMPLVSTISRPHMLHHRPTQVMIDSTFTRHQFWNPTNPMANDDVRKLRIEIVSLGNFSWQFFPFGTFCPSITSFPTISSSFR